MDFDSTAAPLASPKATFIPGFIAASGPPNGVGDG
jgi:hypothetical protein